MNFRSAFLLVAVALLLFSTVGAQSVGAAQIDNKTIITEPNCDGIIELIAHEYYDNDGLISTDITNSPCTEEVNLEEPDSDAESWATMDSANIDTSNYDTIMSSSVTSVGNVLSAEAISTYRNSIINGKTDVEARNAARAATYNLSDNLAKQLRDANNLPSGELYRAIDKSDSAFISKSGDPWINRDPGDYDGATKYCGIIDVRTDSLDLKEASLQFPSALSHGQENFDYVYVAWSGKVWYYSSTTLGSGDSCPDMSTIDRNDDHIDAVRSLTYSDPLEASLLGSKSEETGGNVPVHASVPGASSLGELEVNNVGDTPLRSDYNTLDSKTSNAVGNLDTFRSNVNEAELAAGNTTLTPSELGRRSSDDVPAYALQALALSNQSTLPDSYGGNASNITVNGEFLEDRVLAPSPELANAIGNNLSEGEVIDLDNQSGELRVFNPETGASRSLRSGTVQLKDSADPSGTSDFGTIDINATDPDMTISEFEELSAAIQNATRLDARYAETSSGFFGGDLPINNTTLLIIVGLLVGLAAMRSSGGDS